MTEESTNSPSDESPVGTFDLSCVDCEYSVVIEGTQDDVLKAVEAHQEGGEEDWFAHFVEFERRI